MPSQHGVSSRTRQLRHLSALAADRLRTAILAAQCALEAEEQKLNPNHDARGRFTSGAGVGAVSAAEAIALKARRDALVRAQDRVMSDPVLTQSNPTHCNQATIQVLREVGAPVGDLTDAHGQPLTANAMADALATSMDYREVSPARATALADNGTPVIASWKNPGSNPKDTHGHVATVRPTVVARDKVHANAEPLLANVGGRFSGVRHQSGAIAPSRSGRVLYYAPVLRPAL